ncbi:MAG TPA: 30S ribosomal protein S20 [Polyangiaceae bacterium]|nr:30S ribosomal protein S20 [Polyangiaceae bacterium]
MANHASADKRNRQRVVRTARNRQARSSVRTVLKKAREALAKGDAKAAKQPVTDAAKALARAASKGVLPVNTASRVTSRISAQLAKLAK